MRVTRPHRESAAVTQREAALLGATNPAGRTGKQKEPMAEILLDTWYTPAAGPESGNGHDVPKKHRQYFTDHRDASSVKTIVGWGGLVNADPQLKIVPLMKSYFDQIWRNSCGKCVPCRVGTRVIYDIISDINEGRGTRERFEQMLELSEDIGIDCKCSYGTAFQKPLQDAVQFYRNQWEAALDGEAQGEEPEYSWFMTAPCNHGCPANTDAARYIELITEEKYFEAAEIAYEPDTFATTMGRACFHPCEDLCKRKDVEQPIAISWLKRFATDYQHKMREEGQIGEQVYVSKRTKGKVACIGSGPASIQAAKDLLDLDYDVTVFEMAPVVGGVAHLGIPSYRLPRDLVVQEIRNVEAQGLRVVTDCYFGRDVTWPDLKAQGFDALMLGFGCFRGKKMRVANEDAKYVADAIDYLYDIALHRPLPKPLEEIKRVIVVGGGNTAIDAARSSRHLGIEEVTIVYRRGREQMPCAWWEVDEGVEEGVRFEFLVSPTEVIVNDRNEAVGLRCTRMELGAPDESGRRRPIPIEGSDFDMPCDLIVPAVSQEPVFDYITKEWPDLQVTDWGTVIVDEDTMQSSVPFVFAGGDIATGPDSIITSIGTGRKAAMGIDKYLSEQQGRRPANHRRTENRNRMRHIIDTFGAEVPEEMVSDPPTAPRAEMPTVEPVARIGNFQEVELGFTQDQAYEEARRCMRCFRIVMTTDAPGHSTGGDIR